MVFSGYQNLHLQRSPRYGTLAAAVNPPQQTTESTMKNRTEVSGTLETEFPTLFLSKYRKTWKLFIVLYPCHFLFCCFSQPSPVTSPHPHIQAFVLHLGGQNTLTLKKTPCIDELQSRGLLASEIPQPISQIIVAF